MHKGHELLSMTNALLGRRGYQSARGCQRTVGLETKPGQTVVHQAKKWSTPVCRNGPRMTRLGSILPYIVRGRCLLTASMQPNPPAPPHQSWPGLASGQNSVIANRNLACLLSNRGLYSLLFFLHPTCLVEIQSPFGEGNSLWRLLSDVDILKWMFLKTKVWSWRWMEKIRQCWPATHERRKGESPAPKLSIVFA